MKNLKLFIVAIISIIVIPIIVFADAEGPVLYPYTIRITNPDGAVVIDYDGKESLLPYDTVISNVYNEIEKDGILYIETEQGKIKSSDCALVTDEIDFTRMSDYSGKLYIYKEGAYLYKGPSKIYGKVDNEVMIPVGETVTYTYSDSLFAYVTYKGTSGWLFYYQASTGSIYNELASACIEKSGKIYTINDTSMYNLPIDGERLGKTIPKGTEITYSCYFDKNFDAKYMVTYKGVTGWVNYGENKDIAVISKNAKIFTHLETVKVCKEITNDCKNIVGELPKNVFVPVKYYIFNGDSWFYVDYNNIKGWVFEDMYEGSNIYWINTSYYNTAEYYKIDKDTYLYSDIYGKETETLIKNGKVLVDLEVYDNNNYESKIVWLHIVDKGWIKVNEDEKTVLDEPVEDISEEPVLPNNKPIHNNTNMSIIEATSFIILGALLLSLTVIVVIKLINKNDKKEDKE